MHTSKSLPHLTDFPKLLLAMAPRSIVVFGSGPGIGNNVAGNFAAHGFEHVILLARK